MTTAGLGLRVHQVEGLRRRVAVHLCCLLLLGLDVLMARVKGSLLWLCNSEFRSLPQASVALQFRV